MRAVIQRVARASISDAENNPQEPFASIGKGALALIGCEIGDGEDDALYIAGKIARLRIFEDDDGKMNLSAQDVGAEILAASQFTLLGDARKGRRPSFSKSQDPDMARELIDRTVRALREEWGLATQTGRFGTRMLVSLDNDGPVTILLDSRKTF